MECSSDNCDLKNYPRFKDLSLLIDEQLDTLSTGNPGIRDVALDIAKFTFDLSLASESSSLNHINDLFASLQPSQAPVTRSTKKNADARKDTEEVSPPVYLVPTPLTSLFVDGMDDDQVWQQMDIRFKNVCEALDFILESGPGDDEDGGSDIQIFEDEDEDEDEDAEEDLLEADLESDIGIDDLLLQEGRNENNDEGKDWLENETEYGSDSSDSEQSIGVVDDFRDANDKSQTSPLFRLTESRSNGGGSLDDGFFSLAEFNAETELVEAKSSTQGGLAENEESDSDISIDFFTPVDDNDMVQDGNNHSTIMYRDFFDPPRFSGRISKSAAQLNVSTVTSGRVRFNDEIRVEVLDNQVNGHGKESRQIYGNKRRGESSTSHLLTNKETVDDLDSDSQNPSATSEGTDEDAISDKHDTGDQEIFEEGRTIIERSKDDLFPEDTDAVQDLSTYEKRMTTLRAQISQLEFENIKPKDWVLMGEAGSRQRPQNSLLEEDLEFERAMKVVPIVTQEAIESLEERIKIRIAENRFDDVLRIKAPDDKPALTSRYLELKDTKSTQSLAQIYEEDFLAAQSGDTSRGNMDAKLKKEHEEIERLWEKLSHKLDALCNTHFTPKQPKAVISTISNVPTSALENALPTIHSTSTLLAPEEVFAPSTAWQARSEMTPAQKKSLHNKQRKAKLKLRDTLTKIDKNAKARGNNGSKKQKQSALESVVKSGKGVTVVGKPKMGIKGRKSRHTSLS